MAKKKIVKIIKLQIPAGKANPAPPVGPALGAAQVNIMGFCKEFNAKTQNQAGDILPVEITVYQDKSFDFITKQPPASKSIKKLLGLKSGSGTPNRDKVGQITEEQLRTIAESKAPDMNARSIEAAMRTIAGTAESMGLEVPKNMATGG